MPEAADTFVVHVLDVNRDIYGDCLVVELGTRRILIDGAHPGDHVKKAQLALSIPEQLTEIFNQPSPHHFDLLVVTHCHQDHIGALPAMVRDGSITADWALVADVGLGWPGIFAEDSGLDSRWAQALAGWREEGPLRGDDETLTALLADAASLGDRYSRMLQTLESQGTRVFRFGKDDISELTQQFEEDGFFVLGPTQDQLEICARAIDASARSLLERTPIPIDDAASALAIYRRLTAVDRSLEVDAAGKGRPGAALNNQSLVLLLQRNGRKVLLTGDMQLADPEVEGLAAEMKALRKKIAEAAPFDMVKLPHHGARNGLDRDILRELGSRLLVISTGEGSRFHPHAKTLALLEDPDSALTYFRTDRNGRILVDLSGSEVVIGIERGEKNDATPAFEKDLRDAGSAPGASISGVAPAPTAPTATKTIEAHGGAIHITRSDQEDWVEVIARIPRRPTRVSLTIEVEPLDQPGGVREAMEEIRPPFVPSPRRREDDAGERKVRLPSDLPPLLFVTDSAALVQKIGRAATDRALSAIVDAGHKVLDRRFSTMVPARAAGLVIPEALKLRVSGVVILGGYGVVPPESADALTAVYHQDGSHRENDPDQFFVWSDDHFGRIYSNDLPDLPVSRIPDGGRADLLLGALGATRKKSASSHWALRNARRPFAETIFGDLPGNGRMLVSAPTEARGLGPISGHDTYYFVLHGHLDDASRLTGEGHEGDVEAFRLDTVPECEGAVVFSGCCWGALIADARVQDDQPVVLAPARSVDRSIALSFLARGANAFVGCTGAHYSPVRVPFGYGSAPLHQAFFRHLWQEGKAPAAALCAAKRDFIAGSPYPVPAHQGGPGAPVLAVERKTLLQFCCLGLGW